MELMIASSASRWASCCSREEDSNVFAFAAVTFDKFFLTGLCMGDVFFAIPVLLYPLPLVWLDHKISFNLRDKIQTEIRPMRHSVVEWSHHTTPINERQ